MKKLVNFRPAVFTAVFICAALFSAFLFFTERSAWGIAVSSVTVFSLASFPVVHRIIYGKKFVKRNVILCAVCLFFAAICTINFATGLNGYKTADLNGVYATINGSVESVANAEYGKKITVRDINFKGAVKGKSGYKICVYVYGDGAVDVGDRIEFYSLIKDKNIIYDGRFAAEDIERGVKYYASVNSSDISVLYNSKTVFEAINVAVRDSLKSAMGTDEFAVSYALICGNSEYTDSDVLTGYRNAGVAHIFAVSGLHIGFLAAVLNFIFKKFKLNERISAVIIVLVLVLYSGVCGFSASSLRATVMCGILLFIKAVGGRYDALSSVSLAAIAILCVSPLQLFCAGFDLSFCVALGIILLSKPIAKIFKFLPDKLSSALGTVIGAQAFGLPVSAAFFGEVSLIALPVNLVFVPVVGVIYVFTFISVILSFISPQVFLFLPNLVFTGVNYAVNFFDYDFFIIGGVIVSGLAALYYAALLIFCGLFNLNKKIKWFLSVFLAAIFFAGTALYNLSDKKATKFFVMGSDRLCASLLKTEKQNFLLVSFAQNNFSLNRVARLLSYANAEEISVVILGAADANTVIRKLYGTVKISNAYCYTDLYKEALTDSYKTVNFLFTEKNIFSDKDIYIEYCENGNAVDLKTEGKSFRVFAMLKESPPVGSGEENFDVIVAYDYLERISARYNKSLLISYLAYADFKNAENTGFYEYKF